MIDRNATLAFTAIALVAFVGLLYLGRHGSFFGDEWSFIRIGGLGTLQDWFSPHNEHWSTVPFGLYRMLLLTVGLHSYLPYLGVLLALHVAASAALFILLRRASGSFVALLGSGLFLILGGGFENLFWAFQIGFVTSTAAGLWALVALDRSRPRVAALLFLISISSSAMGLPFLVAGGVELALDRRGRQQLGWLVAVAAIFVAWFAIIGRTGLDSHSLSSNALTDLLTLPRFLMSGVVSAVGATFGLDQVLRALLVIAVVAGMAALLVRRQLPPRAVAAAAGLVGMYFLIGLGRAQLPSTAAPRYIYEAAAFLLIGLSSVIGSRADVLGDPVGSEPLPDRRRTKGSIVLALLIAAVIANAGIANARQLVRGAHFFAEAAGELRATITLIDRYGEALHFDPPPLQRWWLPPPDLLAGAIVDWGTPARDILLPSVVLPPTALERDRALWRLVGSATHPRQIEPPTGAPTADLVADRSRVMPPIQGRTPAARESTGARLVPTGDCIIMDATDGAATVGMTVVLDMADGTVVDLMTIGGGTGAVLLGRDELPDRLDKAPLEYPDRSWAAVGVPRLGDGSVFTLQLLFPSTTSAAVICLDQGARSAAPS